MNRPSIALACILKNEVSNISPLLQSVKGCFDEIHLTDTGSTDGSIELIKEFSSGANPADSQIHLHHFTWCDDFAAARNYSFRHPKTDYVAWLDLDDSLSSAESFIQWRDNVLKLADFWLATYHYASDANGNPLCSFARERVVKRDLELKWKYFIHEGMIPLSAKKKDIAIQYATTWQVIHRRNHEDLSKDRSRNLQIFEKRKDELDTRLNYYYGKELYENHKPLEAFQQLVSVLPAPDLEPHDRIMGIQYAALCAMQLNQFEKAIQLAHQGLQLEPLRAEFLIAIADSYLKLGKMAQALPYYMAATTCPYTGNSKIQGATFAHADSYNHYPLLQLARIYVQMGDIEKGESFAEKALALGPNMEALGVANEIKTIKEKAGLNISGSKLQTEDIVISCHPTGFYEWDEEIYKTKGIGGSETAAVEMAKHLSEKTGRNVLIFNNRETKKEFGRVSYLPARELPLYFAKHKPRLHIAWRHNIKFTDAPTYLWSHDLGCPGIENHANYEKVLALSEFHKSYLMNMLGVPADKILVTSNGIDPSRFQGLDKTKVLGKIVFSSSPDRGLDVAIEVMDRVVKARPEAKLYAYYGFDNMLKNGKNQEVEKLKAMIASRPYVEMRGNIPQDELRKELASACVWLYPANFLETYCITAVEMLCASVWPVVRSWGALPDTLKGYPGDLIEGLNPDDYSACVVEALKQESYKQVDVSPVEFSWSRVAETWIELMHL